MKEALIEYLEAYPFRTKAKDNYLFFNPRTLHPKTGAGLEIHYRNL